MQGDGISVPVATGRSGEAVPGGQKERIVVAEIPLGAVVVFDDCDEFTLGVEAGGSIQFAQNLTSLNGVSWASYYTTIQHCNMIIKNNILVNTASGAHPIYMGTAGNAVTDYNCIYAPTYAGYSGSAMTAATPIA